MKTQRLCNNSIVGEGRRGKQTAIKAIKKRLRLLVVERGRDPLINRPEISAGYKIIRLGKLGNTQAHLNLDARVTQKQKHYIHFSGLGKKMVLRGTLSF